jgi:DASH complex subunit DAD3
MLERKTATVYTLLKASVYSIVLQQQIINDGEAEAEAAQQRNPIGGGGGDGLSMFEGDETVTH